MNGMPVTGENRVSGVAGREKVRDWGLRRLFLVRTSPSSGSNSTRATVRAERKVCYHNYLRYFRDYGKIR